MSDAKNRIQWIDFIRMLAILGILLCHATEGIYAPTVDSVSQLSFASELFCFTSFTFGRLGVPLFLMITGYLLLDRDYDKAGMTKFWKNNFLHLLICTWIWFGIYEIYNMIRTGAALNILQILEDLLFIHPVGLSHAWYMPVILAIYGLIPFAARALKGLGIKVIMLTAIILSVYTYAIPTLKVINDAAGLLPDIDSQFYAGFSGGIYGLYLIWGYLIKKEALKKCSTAALTAIGAVSFCAAVFMQVWLYGQGTAYNIWYDNIFVMSSAVIIFELISRQRKTGDCPVVRAIARYSFPIYLIHNLIRCAVLEPIKAFSTGLPVKVALTFILCLGGSLAIAWIINKIPKAGKYILYMK